MTLFTKDAPVLTKVDRAEVIKNRVSAHPVPIDWTDTLFPTYIKVNHGDAGFTGLSAVVTLTNKPLVGMLNPAAVPYEIVTATQFTCGTTVSTHTATADAFGVGTSTFSVKVDTTALLANQYFCLKSDIALSAPFIIDVVANPCNLADLTVIDTLVNKTFSPGATSQ